MAGSVNKVILVGNLGREPESRSMQSGDKVVNLSVATSENWRDRQSGERREKTEWHRVVIFDQNLADVAEKYYYMPNDHQRIEQVALLVDSGYSKKILLGHDICTKHRLKAFGGHGWDHILINIVPRMKKYGISTQDIKNMIAKNPQKILTII